MTLSDDDVREILRIIDESQLDELRLDTDGFSLHVRRGGAPELELDSAPAPRAVAAPAAEPSATLAAEPPTVPTAADDGHHEIAAPMLGTFYRAEAPGQPPFVEVGASVEPHTVVCLIEVMKMMNSIEAGVAGTIVEVCAENAQLVEPGQPLFRVEPAS